MRNEIITEEEEEEQERFDVAEHLSMLDSAMKHLWTKEQALVRLIQAGASQKAVSVLLDVTEGHVTRFKKEVIEVLRAFVWRETHKVAVESIHRQLPEAYRDVLFQLESRRSQRELSANLGISRRTFVYRMREALKEVEKIEGSKEYLRFLHTIVLHHKDGLMEASLRGNK